MNKLIPGGMYTMPDNENTFYIFIKEAHNEEYFLEVYCTYINAKNIQEYISETVLFWNDYMFEKHILHSEKSVFSTKYNGFIGIVDKPLLDSLIQKIKN